MVVYHFPPVVFVASSVALVASPVVSTASLVVLTASLVVYRFAPVSDRILMVTHYFRPDAALFLSASAGLFPAA